MNLEWIWLTGAGAVVAAAGFWAKEIHASVKMMNTTMTDILGAVSKMGEKLEGHKGRLDRIEEFIDRFAERRK